MLADLLQAYLLSGIKGRNEVLNNPRDVSAFAHEIDISERLFFVSDPLTTVYCNADTGDDDTGDGSFANPFAQPRRASQRIALANGVLKTIFLQAATAQYVINETIFAYMFINIEGEQVIEETRDITAVGAAGFTTGIVCTVNNRAGQSTLVDDAWENRILSVTNVLSNARGIIVHRNVGNVIYGIMHNRTFTSDAQTNPTTTGDLNLLKLPEVLFTGSVGMLANFQMNFRFIKAVGATADLFCNATDKIEFRYCQVEVRNITGGRGGGVFMTSSSLALYGTATTGILQARNGGDLRLGWGTVVTDKNAAVNSCWLNIGEDSKLVWEGYVFFRGLDTNGIFFNGANSFVLSTSGANNFVYFDDYPAAGSNAAAFKINQSNTVGGFIYGIPRCIGKVNNNFYIYAQLGADVTCNILSAIVTLLGTNTVTTDGTNPSAQSADGTVIHRATPRSSYFYLPPVRITNLTTPYTVDQGVVSQMWCATNLAAIVINLPAVATIGPGSILVVMDTGANAAANNITINAGAGTTIEGAAAAVLNTNKAVRIYTFVSDGVAIFNWQLLSSLN